MPDPVRRRPLPERPITIQRRAQAPARKGWDEQERASASLIPGGERVRGSGCSRLPSRKSDVSGTWLRNEDKTTGKATIRIARQDVEKIKVEALANRQRPSLTLGFDAHGALQREDWMAFPAPLAGLLLSVVDAIIKDDVDEARELADLIARAV